MTIGNDNAHIFFIVSVIIADRVSVATAVVATNGVAGAISICITVGCWRYGFHDRFLLSFDTSIVPFKRYLDRSRDQRLREQQA